MSRYTQARKPCKRCKGRCVILGAGDVLEICPRCQGCGLESDD